jgi:hypothetical protein
MKRSDSLLRTAASLFFQTAIVFSSAPIVMAQESPPPAAAATPNPFVVQDNVKRVSDHVWAIPDGGRFGVPNVGIIVGSRATLVLDTGMGPKSGEVDAREAQKLGKNNLIYLTTSDFRPEHVSGGQCSRPTACGSFPRRRKPISKKAR